MFYFLQVLLFKQSAGKSGGLGGRTEVLVIYPIFMLSQFYYNINVLFRLHVLLFPGSTAIALVYQASIPKLLVIFLIRPTRRRH